MSSLPDVLNVKPLPTIQTMNVETNTLDPIVINQSFCRFVLEKKGILDVGSTITFSVHPVTAGSNKCFLPIKTGIHSLIKRAVLKVGTKTIANSDEYAYYQTMKRAFKIDCEMLSTETRSTVVSARIAARRRNEKKCFLKIDSCCLRARCRGILKIKHNEQSDLYPSLIRPHSLSPSDGKNTKYHPNFFNLMRFSPWN